MKPRGFAYNEAEPLCLYKRTSLEELRDVPVIVGCGLHSCIIRLRQGISMVLSSKCGVGKPTIGNSVPGLFVRQRDCSLSYSCVLCYNRSQMKPEASPTTRRSLFVFIRRTSLGVFRDMPAIVECDLFLHISVPIGLADSRPSD